MSKKKATGLGKTLIRDHKKDKAFVSNGYRHTADLPDGFDWARLNLHSVTEKTSLDDFLDQVEIVSKEYSEEFGNGKYVKPNDDILTENEKRLIIEAHETNKDILGVPRRPCWDITTTKEALDMQEKTEFINWRRKLAFLRGKKYINLTPYEKNLEVWRQLWRVIEKSDVIVQIVDARNPLLFRCEDLELYVKEIDARKRNILLLNKADFLAEEQRKYWAHYFDEKGMAVVFFSAIQESQKLSEIIEDQDSDNNDHANPAVIKESKEISENADLSESDLSELSESDSSEFHEGQILSNSSKVYTQEELISFFKQFDKLNEHAGFITIGLVGYPNVGKSSTINSIMHEKKVQVSSTPGKTKHFQTLMVDSDLCLCDCPGLVFPNFVSSKAEMVVNGILPIDHLTDHKATISLIVDLLPKTVFEHIYSLVFRPRSEGSESCKLTAEELLDAHGYMRGYMTQRGIPDSSRSARYILKDFVNGKLLYCYAPPDVDDEDYQKYTNRPLKQRMMTTSAQRPSSKFPITLSEEVDRRFFQKNVGQAHTKGVKSLAGHANPNLGSKPWKKHNNRNKKEKLRRVYSDASY